MDNKSANRKTKSRFLSRAQRNIFTGILTVIPLWFTWIVFEFILNQLSKIGLPSAIALAREIEKHSPYLAELLQAPWLLNTIAILLTIIALYFLGWVTSVVIGQRLIKIFEYFIHRIPLVQSVYSAVKKFLSVLQTKPDELQRVVLIEFPSPEMKAVGFVTRVFNDETTGRQLAAVYVPTTPNPTSGYLEIVPTEKLVSTDWSMDQAMTFIISGGAVSPDHIRYDHPSDIVK
ncbi:MAG: DUF502 domain-containing protein [Thioalkalispiraceae bacterium]|jgi:uncharacterized membrane protein